MPLKKLKCKWCKKYQDREKVITTPRGRFCSHDCMMIFVKSEQEKQRVKALKKANADIKKKERARRASDRAKKKELMSFSSKMAFLQKLYNQYHRDVLHPSDNCYTCGAQRGSVKFDWGHFIPVGAGGGDRRRFMPENGRPQCSVRCNQHGSGMRNEFRQNLINEKGTEWVEWLENESNHSTLKEQFPTHQSWLDDVARMRKLIRDAGLKPVA